MRQGDSMDRKRVLIVEDEAVVQVHLQELVPMATHHLLDGPVGGAQ